MIRREIAFCLTALFVFTNVHAQTPEAAMAMMPARSSTTDTRPKIGLVLSGGGARGWAHVGVLRWFEEHRIPVDYVAGTSMGGLVGAMYAMGSSPSEIQEIGNDLDWDRVLSGPPSFDELSFRRKEDRREYPGDIELGAGRGIRLPSGINPGHNIGLVLANLTLPYATLRNFDDLPIPFRCVATDMLEAKPVIFKSGPLPIALRATMSIPGLFTPVKVDDKVLADGGLLNNIPTDVAKDMGADVTIAVNVGTPLGGREDILSLPGILSQMISVTTSESDRRHLQLADLVITPDLGRYTLMDFKEVNAISDLGYQAAAKNGAALERFALNENDWKAHLDARQARRRSAIPTPTALEVKGTTPQNSQAISHILSPKLDKPIDPEVLGSELSQIRGGGRFDSLSYTVANGNERSRLQIQVRDKNLGPALLIPIVQLQSFNISNVKFSIGGRFTMFDVGGHGSELRIDAIVGSNNLLGVEYYRPIGEKGLFVAPRARFLVNSADLFVDGDRVAEYRQREGAVGLDLGYIFNRRSQLSIGYEVGRESAQVSIGDPLLPTIKGLLSDVRTQFVYEGRDSAIVPTRGSSLNVEGRWFFAAPGSAQAFPQAEVRASSLKPLSDKSSLFVYGGAGTTFSRTAAPLQQFTLGGPLRLSAFGLQEFRGDHYLLLGGGYLHRVGYLPRFVGGKIYGAGWYEVGSAFFNHADADYRSSLSGALILETHLGPLVLGGGAGSGGRGRIFISLGRLF